MLHCNTALVFQGRLKEDKTEDRYSDFLIQLFVY